MITERRQATGEELSSTKGCGVAEPLKQGSKESPGLWCADLSRNRVRPASVACGKFEDLVMGRFGSGRAEGVQNWKRSGFEREVVCVL